MKLSQLLLQTTILLISLATAQPTTPPRGLIDGLPNPFASAPSAVPSTAPAQAATCRCTIVFGDKTSLSVNTAVGSTNGVSGETAGKKACTAQLLVGTGCEAALSSESANNCVTSQACITASG